MTDLEFKILDELYFVTSFEELKIKTNIESDNLKSELMSLVQKDWVKLFEPDFVTEIEYVSQNFQSNFNSYCYLATKKGLFEHNSI